MIRSRNYPFLWNRGFITVFSELNLIPFPVSRVGPVHHFTSYFSKVKAYFNIIIQPTPKSPNQSLVFRFPDLNFTCIFISCIPDTCLIHLILLDLITLISGEEYTLCSFSLCSFLHPALCYLLFLGSTYSHHQSVLKLYHYERRNSTLTQNII